MYYELLFIHGIVRWIVLVLLIWSLLVAWRGSRLRLAFSKSANALRHWTATAAHLQLTIGIGLYASSPLVKAYSAASPGAARVSDGLFFGVVHSVTMIIAIIVLTIGSAMTKRRAGDTEKYRTMALWFAATLVLIFVAIPWPFSPLAQRPFFRTY